MINKDNVTAPTLEKKNSPISRLSRMFLNYYQRQLGELQEKYEIKTAFLILNPIATSKPQI